MPKQLTHRSFEPYLSTNFFIHYSEDGVYEAELVSIDTIGKEPKKSEQRWSFSLVFHVKDIEKYLTQRIYRLDHPKMGNLEVFLVPLGPDEQGTRYEAVFT